MEKFKGKYTIGSKRLRYWDYSDDGYYFITICTKDRICYLGEIVNDKMQLSEIGKIVQKYWNEIPEHFPNILLDEFVVMPNHVHGIIIINHENQTNADSSTVETCHGMFLQRNQFSKPIPGALSTIINQYKSSVTRFCKKNNIDFAWQPRFYDRIIRTEKELFNVRTYIQDNPLKWDTDKNNKYSKF